MNTRGTIKRAEILQKLDHRMKTCIDLMADDSFTTETFRVQANATIDIAITLGIIDGEEAVTIRAIINGCAGRIQTERSAELLRRIRGYGEH